MIDWSKPIELNTVPPRPARAGYVYDDKSGARVYADWRSGVPGEWRACDNEGVTSWVGSPRVRNVTTTADDFAIASLGSKRVQPIAASADDVTAELLAALKGLLADTQHSKHNCGDDDCPVDIARKVVAKAEART